MDCAESPAEAIFSISSFSAAFPTSERALSPRFGNSHLSSACRHPQIVAGLTGLRRRVERESIHLSAWARNLMAGAVFVVKDCSLLMPVESIYLRSFCLAMLAVRQTPRKQSSVGGTHRAHQPKTVRKQIPSGSTVCNAETHCLSDQFGVTRMVLVSASSSLRTRW